MRTRKTVAPQAPPEGEFTHHGLRKLGTARKRWPGSWSVDPGSCDAAQYRVRATQLGDGNAACPFCGLDLT